MKRVAAITVLLAIAGLLAVLIAGTSAQGSSSATFDVVFDNARGLIGGQLVKVAGAKAGTIEDVSVVNENGVFRARIRASIDSKFMPFRQNATCSIRPEGLIAENYVDCDPGSPPSPPLSGVNGQPPTVPVTHTSEPVSLLDLFNIFNLPTRQRFQVIIDELGVGTAGRGDDFNDIIRRANPALKLANRAIGILARQKAQLAQIIDDAGQIAYQGASHTADVQNFLTHAAALTQLTSSHSSSLSRAIRELPANLDATQPALQQLDTVARDGTPLLSEIHAAVPELNNVANDLGPFVTAAKPALAKLGTAITTAIPAIKKTTPLIKTLRSYLGRSLPATRLFARLATNLQQAGLPENFLSILYYVGAATAREDSTSHLLSLLLVGPASGACSIFATTPSAACSAHFAPQASATAARAPAKTSSTPQTPSTPQAGSTPAAPTTPAAGGGSNPTPTGTTGLLGTGIAIPGLPTSLNSALGKAGQAVQGLLNYLLK
jgi:ABC-type transporter Mla subunit MlaD